MNSTSHRTWHTTTHIATTSTTFLRTSRAQHKSIFNKEICRTAGLLLMAACLYLCIGVNSVHAGKHTPEEIRKAIKDLGDKSFGVREKASKLLWEAGADAEAPLRDALSSEDAETARRARVLLDKFNWGIFPETPADVVEQINLFRNGDKNVRLQVAGRLLGMGKIGYTTLKRLAEMETNPADKQAIFSQMAQEAQKALPALLAAGDVAATEELLDRCLLAGSEEGYTNFAAFQALRGRLPEAIAKAEREWANTKSHGAGELLVHLYRAKGDFAKGRAIAKQVGDSLVEQLLWEEGNWKELSIAVKKSAPAAPDATSLGMRAAVYRLAGDHPAFEAAVAQLRKLGETDDRFNVRSTAEALLLNGRADDALKILQTKKLAPSMTFDLLVTQMRYKEAFELAADAKPDEKDERFRLELRVARTLFILGDRDQALQRFNHLGDSLKEAGDLSSARDLIKSMVHSYLREHAVAMAGHYLGQIHKQNVTEGWDQVLEPLFDENAGVAVVWWRFLRGKLVDRDPEKLMQMVAALLEGKPVEGRDGWALELSRKENGTDDLRGSPALAAAVVMLRAGQEDKARDYFERALKQQPDSAIAIRYADFLAERGRHREAAQWYERAGKVEPGNALALFLRGSSLLKAGDATEGKRLMELAHWAPLGNEYERGRLAQELERRRFSDAAQRERETVLTVGWYRHWQVGNVLSQVARHALRARDYDRAIACYEKAIAGCLNKGASYVDATAYLTAPQIVVQTRVRALLAAKKFDEALPAIRASLAVLPGNVELALASIRPLQAAGRTKEADDIFTTVMAPFESLCRDHPNSAFGQNSVAWLAANCNRDLDKALTHAQTAVKLEPKAANYLDTLAEVRFRRGDQDKAIELMKRCLELEPGRAYYVKQLARMQKGDRSAPVPDANED